MEKKGYISKNSALAAINYPDRSAKLKHWLKENKITQAEFGELMGGYPQPYISQLCSGTRAISDKTAEQILKLQEDLLREKKGIIRKPISRDWFLGTRDSRLEEAVSKAKKEGPVLEAARKLIDALFFCNGLSVQRNPSDLEEYLLFRQDEENPGFVAERELEKLSMEIARIADQVLFADLASQDYRSGQF